MDASREKLCQELVLSACAAQANVTREVPGSGRLTWTWWVVSVRVEHTAPFLTQAVLAQLAEVAAAGEALHVCAACH